MALGGLIQMMLSILYTERNSFSFFCRMPLIIFSFPAAIYVFFCYLEKYFPNSISFFVLNWASCHNKMSASEFYVWPTKDSNLSKSEKLNRQFLKYRSTFVVRKCKMVKSRMKVDFRCNKEMKETVSSIFGVTEEHSCWRGADICTRFVFFCLYMLNVVLIDIKVFSLILS